MAAPEQSPAVGLALQLLGATAGLAAVATVTGGGLLWLRFDALALPGDEAVSVLPKSVLLAVGLRSLALPVCLGVLATLVVILSGPLDEKGRPRKRLWVITVLLVALPAVYAMYQVIDFEVPEVAIMAVAVLCAIGAIMAVAFHESRRETSLAWTVGLAFVAVGVVLAVVKTIAAPVMEPVAVLTKAEDYAVSGFYVGQTSDRFYMAPLPGGGQRDYAFADARVDRILEIPRDTIVRTALRAPIGIRPDEPGREQAASLLTELRAEGLPPVEPTVVTTPRPILAFAPLVHLHAHEDLWPMSADLFLEHSRLLWAHDSKCPDYSPTLKREVDPDKPAGQDGRDAFDVARLGVKSSNPYRHQPVDDECKVHDTAFAASDHTRPYDRRERDPDLPLKEGWYLDLDDDFGKGEERRDQQGAQTVLTGVPVYAEMYDEAVEKRPGKRIVYWFFYGLSRSPGPREIVDQFKHEGDWERISVLLEEKGAGRYLPISARYHSHDERRDIPWSALSLVASIEEGLTHPVVYSARGSHASFARAGRYDAVFDPSGRKLLTVDDEAIACPRCPVWRTWENVRNAAKEPWYGFGGAWGDVRNQSDTSGPLGPSRYKTKGLSLSPSQTVAPSPDADIATLGEQ